MRVQLISLKWASRPLIFGAAIILATIYHQGVTAVQTAPQPRALGSVISPGQAKDGLAAFVFSDKSKVKLGEDFRVYYGVVFLGNSDPPKQLRLLRPRLATGVNNFSWFTVKGPDGEQIPYTGPKPRWPREIDTSNEITLNKGAFYGLVEKNLFDTYKIVTPGEYTVFWTHLAEAYKGLWAGELTSNEIRVEIVR